ncbi:MAG TPA: hypothetical protein VHD36_00235, partial [Pirellulales bacterium]|nr:hypothetical protein [Pirellulales bacterium]
QDRANSSEGSQMTVERTARQILFHGLGMVLAGLVWGFVVPATPFPRLALTAHIEFTSNGVLFIVLAVLLVALLHNVGPRSAALMLLAAWLTWVMLASEVANAWWGTKSTLPIAAAQAGAAGAVAWQETAVTLAHIAAGVGLVVAWTLLIVGLARRPQPNLAR